MDLDFVRALVHGISEYRNFSRLPQVLPAGSPFLDEPLNCLIRFHHIPELFVLAFCLTLLSECLTSLFSSSCWGFRSWQPRSASQGLCRSLDTHRGPKSPARERRGLVLFLVVVVLLLGIDVMSTLNPYASPWRPAVLTPPRVSVEPIEKHVLSTSQGAKLSGTGPSLNGIMYNQLPRRKLFFVLSRWLNSMA